MLTATVEAKSIKCSYATYKVIKKNHNYIFCREKPGASISEIILYVKIISSISLRVFLLPSPLPVCILGRNMEIYSCEL